MASAPIYIGSYRSQFTQLLPGHSTRGVVLFAAGASGSRVHFATWACPSQSTQIQGLTVYLAQRVTKQEDMGVGAFVDGGAGSDTITRTVGDFTTDGWKVGQFMLVSGSTTLANDFGPLILTGVAAGTLTFATATVNTAENMIAGGRLWKTCMIGSILTPAPFGGQISGPTFLPSKTILDPAAIPGVQVTPQGEVFLMLGPNDALVGALSNVVTVNTITSVSVVAGDY